MSRFRHGEDTIPEPLVAGRLEAEQWRVDRQDAIKASIQMTDIEVINKLGVGEHIVLFGDTTKEQDHKDGYYLPFTVGRVSGVDSAHL